MQKYIVIGWYLLRLFNSTRCIIMWLGWHHLALCPWQCTCFSTGTLYLNFANLFARPANIIRFLDCYSLCLEWPPLSYAFSATIPVYHFINCLGLSSLARPGLGTPLSSCLEGVAGCYKFQRWIDSSMHDWTWGIQCNWNVACFSAIAEIIHIMLWSLFSHMVCVV